jgi:pyrimidine deaminase RibD-like protein
MRLNRSPLQMDFRQTEVPHGVTRVSEKFEDWKAITPGTLVAPVAHIRNMFDKGVRKCCQVTEKLCFAELHPDDKQVDLNPFRSAFATYREIISPAAIQRFDRDHQLGTPPAIFHAFLQAFSAGISSEIHRLFKDLLQIGIAHSARLNEYPAEWAKTHLSILVNRNKHVVKLWIKSVCDKQDHSRPTKTTQEIEDFVLWKDWQAPKLIYMQPSGNLPYNSSTAWNREDEEMTLKLLEGFSSRFNQIFGFDLEKIAGDAHVELEKTAEADDDRRFALMAIEEALKSIPEDWRPHPKVGAIVVKNGSLLSKAHRGENSKSHAEYIALEDKLSDDLVAGATVYTTLEPCTTRKHPKIPCAQRLVDRKVSRVVIGMLDPNPDIRGLGDQLLSEANIETQLFPQDLRAQVEEMNREFIRAQKQKQTPSKTNEGIESKPGSAT